MTASLTVVVTRPREQASAWVQALRGQGVEAIAVPLLGIDPVPDASPLVEAWRRMDALDLLVFVSPNAVSHFFAARPEGAGTAWPATTLTAAPGPGTRECLIAAGVPSEQCMGPADDAAQFDSEALWARLCKRDWQGRRVLLVRGEGGREWLGDRLREAGAQVEAVQAYARGAPTWDGQEREAAQRALQHPQLHRWLLSSSEALGYLPGLCDGMAPAVASWRELAPGLQVWATHPRIAQAAQALGAREVRVIRPGLADLLAEVAGQRASCGIG